MIRSPRAVRTRATIANVISTNSHVTHVAPAERADADGAVGPPEESHVAAGRQPAEGQVGDKDQPAPGQRERPPAGRCPASSERAQVDAAGNVFPPPRPRAGAGVGADEAVVDQRRRQERRRAMHIPISPTQRTGEQCQVAEVKRAGRERREADADRPGRASRGDPGPAGQDRGRPTAPPAAIRGGPAGRRAGPARSRTCFAAAGPRTAGRPRRSPPPNRAATGDVAPPTSTPSRTIGEQREQVVQVVARDRGLPADHLEGHRRRDRG